MLLFATLWLGAFPTVESKDFSVEIQHTALAATVQIIAAEKQEGSGVFVGIREGEGFILTARHVVAKSTDIEVLFFSAETYPKSSQRIKASRVVLDNPIADLALLRFKVEDRDSFPKPMLIRSLSPKEKEFSAMSAGASLGKAPTLIPMEVRGRKLLERPDQTNAFFWETREAPQRGRSGGPLIDSRGELIGICSGEQKESGYFTHLDEIRSWLRKTSNGEVRWLVDPKK